MTKKTYFKLLMVSSIAVLLISPADTGAQQEQQIIKKPDLRKPPVFRKLPDLIISIRCPRIAYPGKELKSSFKVRVKNQGLSEAKNFFVDIVLSRDMNIPVQLAGYSPNFHDDVLLKGGREHIASLKAGESVTVPLNGTNKIPDDTPWSYSLYLGAVVDPGKTVAESNETNNTTRCLLSMRMHIRNMSQFHGGSPSAEISLYGEGFGTGPGTNQVYMGTGVASVMYWEPDFILVSPPPGIAYGKVHQVSIKKGMTNISNVYPFLLRRWFDGPDPWEGTPGTQVRLWGFHLGATQGTKTLKIGMYTITNIIAWTNGYIDCTIPPGVPAGSYEIQMYQGPSVISNKATFNVN